MHLPEDESKESTPAKTEKVEQEQGATKVEPKAEATEKVEPKPDADKQEDKAFNKEALLADLHKERDRRKTLQAQVEQLTAKTSSLNAQSEELAAVQRKYDRLEQFLLGVGGPLSKALDSKTFSTKLFETDDPIEDIVTAWQAANPSTASKALSSSAAPADQKKSDIGDLLRQALTAGR